MAEQRQDVQLEPTYSSSVPIRDVALKIGQKRWTIWRSGERRLEISVLIVQHDDHDSTILVIVHIQIKGRRVKSHFQRFGF